LQKARSDLERAMNPAKRSRYVELDINEILGRPTNQEF